MLCMSRICVSIVLIIFHITIHRIDPHLNSLYSLYLSMYIVKIIVVHI